MLTLALRHSGNYLGAMLTLALSMREQVKQSGFAEK